MRTLLACLVALPLAACAPATVPNDPETAADCPWSYGAGDTGPANWARLCPPQFPYAGCNGEQQSPIVLSDAQPADLPRLVFDEYGETGFNVVEMYWGQELQAQAPPGAQLYLQVGSEVGSPKYRLAQFHFHNPCEHCAEPRPERELELHLVHLNASGVVEAVVGVRVSGGGGANAAFQAFLDKIPPPPGGVATLDPRALLPPEPRGYYHYQGSLTTPACSQGVRWYVLKQAIRVSDDQIDRFRSRYRYTARPLQRQRPVLQSRD